MFLEFVVCNVSIQCLEKVGKPFICTIKCQGKQPEFNTSGCCVPA